MINKERLLKYEAYSDPFPVLEIKDFLDEEDCRLATEELKNTKFDEFVRLNRSNIRKGSDSFDKLLEKNKVFKKLYNFFNNEEQYKILINELEKVSSKSEYKFIMQNKPNKFLQHSFKHKRNIHDASFTKKLTNFLRKKIYDKLFNYYYFDIHFSLAKKGYAMKTHRDNDTRFLTFLLYFNTLENEDGGCFEIYKKDKDFDKNITHPENGSVSVIKKIRPEAGKLIVFLSNPLSYHNAEAIKNDVSRCFCYGSYTSNKNINWIKSN